MPPDPAHAPASTSSEALEALHRQDEDGGAAHLDLDWVGHVELAGFHDRGHRVHELLARVAVCADELEHRVDLVVLHTDEDRRVSLLQEPARRVEAGGAVLLLEQRVDQRRGILVVDDGGDALHPGALLRSSTLTETPGDSMAQGSD